MAVASLKATRVMGITPRAEMPVKMRAELVRLDRAVLLVDEHLVEAARRDQLGDERIGRAGPAAVARTAGRPDRLERVLVSHRRVPSRYGR